MGTTGRAVRVAADHLWVRRFSGSEDAYLLGLHCVSAWVFVPLAEIALGEKCRARQDESNQPHAGSDSLSDRPVEHSIITGVTGVGRGRRRCGHGGRSANESGLEKQ